jgi:hypothetical protein
LMYNINSLLGTEWMEILRKVKMCMVKVVPNCEHTSLQQKFIILLKCIYDWSLIHFMHLINARNMEYI